MWIINTYLHGGTTSKIQNLFGTVQNHVPINEISQLLMVGDFNIDLGNKESDQFELMKKLCKYIGVRIESPSRDTRMGAVLDYIICGKNIRVAANKVWKQSCSDHLAVSWEIEVNFPSKMKQIKIPSRRTAEEITSKLLSNKEVINSAAFLDELYLYRQDNHNKIKQLVKFRPRDFQLFDKLITLDDPTKVKETINRHWSAIWEETEKKRWSQESKTAYNDLKSHLKYHLYEKRDGGIINQVITDEGKITNTPKEVNEHLAKTIEEIQIDNRWEYLEEKPFPVLSKLSEEQMIKLIEGLSSGKAITLDGMTDSIFQKQITKRTAEIFKDLWTTDLTKIEGMAASFTSRLVPLNKVFPKTPTRKQMRPILVCSPLQKMMEARFLPKLTDYLKKKLHKSQIGFVPGQGVEVNLLRAICKIKISTEEKKKQCKYGLFIDFANAYNTVPHKLLFQKLRQKKCMDDDEIDYLEALYSRYRIRIGDRVIKYNRGVAQGSILSPALFDIYIEDLAQELADITGLSYEDVLFYADDILVLCQTQLQLKRCIKVIEDWCARNGMELNKKKSAILPFGPRAAKDISLLKLEKIYNQKTNKTTREWTPIVKEIDGIPVVSVYKYLGMYLEPKLTMSTQLESIRKKSDFLFVKLYPYLANATADGRRDMWRTMVVPLFNPILLMSKLEKSKTAVEKGNTLLLMTFKRFLMIPKVTNSELVYDMMGEYFDDTAARMKHNAGEKWFARREDREPELLKKERAINYLKGIPNSWCDILKQQCRLCIKCKNSNRNSDHMWHKHQTDIVSYKEIWQCIKNYHDNEVKKHEKKKTIMKLKRGVFLTYWKPLLKNIKEVIDERFDKIYRIKNEE